MTQGHHYLTRVVAVPDSRRAGERLGEILEELNKDGYQIVSVVTLPSLPGFSRSMLLHLIGVAAVLTLIAAPHLLHLVPEGEVGALDLLGPLLLLAVVPLFLRVRLPVSLLVVAQKVSP